MIDRGAQVPVKRQSELLELSRSSVYYTPRLLSERDLGLMRPSLVPASLLRSWDAKDTK